MTLYEEVFIGRLNKVLPPEPFYLFSKPLLAFFGSQFERPSGVSRPDALLGNGHVLDYRGTIHNIKEMG